MPNIVNMDYHEILALEPQDVTSPLATEEFLHIAKTLGAFWEYDYEALKEGKPGLHAELKSGLHSNGFFSSKILLRHENIRRIMSLQILMCIKKKLARHLPAYVAGIPNGATLLGKDIAGMLCANQAEMVKVDDKILLLTEIGSRDILLVEDFCTRGTGFIEAATYIHKNQPKAKILLYNAVIMNRGGLKHIVVSEVGIFTVVSVVEKEMDDWKATECPLCALDSKPIKPKATDANWIAITESQK